MKYRVELTAKAEWDVEVVLRWFHEQRATAVGGRWLKQLMTRIDTLESHPDHLWGIFANFWGIFG